LDHIFLEPEPKNLDAWSWSRSLNFENRLNNPDAKFLEKSGWEIIRPKLEDTQ